MWNSILETIKNFIEKTGISLLISDENWWQYLIMYAIAGILIYLAIAKQFEPLLLLPIAIGILLTNLPGAGLFHFDMWMGDSSMTVLESLQMVVNKGGFLDLLYIGVKLGIYPCLIFVGIGAMTDFTPLIANPKYFIIGAGAQFGVVVAFASAFMSGLYTLGEAASIGIIGGADGPTAILVTKTLGPALLGAIAIAAYSYMALIPLIQPPLMRLITTKKEREIKMEQLKPVSKRAKIIFPIVVTIFTVLLLPDVAPLLGCLMLGNLFRECGVCDRLSDTAQNALMNIVTIFLGISVGATTVGKNFLSTKTIYIIILGLIAFAFSTIGGLLFGKLMCKLSGGKINPLIGSAGVSAVPMAARVAQVEGQKANPSNFLLMHAMGPNVAGVIGSAVAAGFLLTIFK